MLAPDLKSKTETKINARIKHPISSYFLELSLNRKRNFDIIVTAILCQVEGPLMHN